MNRGGEPAKIALGLLKLTVPFHDHVRIEGMAFDGTIDPEPGGLLRPDRTSPGHGLTVKQAHLDKFRVA